MPYRPSRLYRTILLLILSGFSLFIVVVPAFAAGDEETVALNFLKFLRSDKAILSAEILQGNALAPALPPVAIGRLFHLAGGGYLLVSSDRTISPVKAYSLSGDFAALPPAYRQALLSELELRVRAAMAAAAVRAPLAAEPAETERQWDFLLTFDGAARQPLAYAPGTFLLASRWNQTYPYNKFLPAAGGQTVVAGCVNVALAQVMRYHRYPAASRGVVSYTWTPSSSQSEVLKTILYRNYNWANMPDAVNAMTPPYQADEVALLLKDLGIANRTAFDADGSSTSLDIRMIMENFGYSTGLLEMDDTTYAGAGGFLEALKEEFAAERPVLLTFPGHMVVADGYRTDFTGDRIHINMGWGGAADDFYFLNAPVTAGGYVFPTGAGNLRIYYKIKPCNKDNGDCAVNLEPGDGFVGLAMAGGFNREKDTDLYPAYLKGQTTISGTRFYGDQAYYDNLAFSLFIINAADGSIVYQVPDPGTPESGGAVFSAGNLPAGKYGVRVSLCNENGTHCYLQDTSNRYTVTLTSEALTEEDKAVVDQALDKPPVIGNTFPDLILNTASGIRKILIDARDENGDAVTLGIQNSNAFAVGTVLNGNILSLTPTGTAKVASRITVAAAANGKTVEKSFTVMTDSGDTAFGKSFTVGGIFAGQSDVKTHQAILDGACTITGYNGFSNQGFFSSVLNASGVVSPAIDAEISATFSRGIYFLTASLESPGSYYTFMPGKGDVYTLTVSCPNADESATTIAGLLGIDLSGSVSWGDVNGDYQVNLADAILALQVLSLMDTSGKTISIRADVNGDDRIWLGEAIFILQRTAGLRN